MSAASAVPGRISIVAIRDPRSAMAAGRFLPTRSLESSTLGSVTSSKTFSATAMSTTCAACTSACNNDAF